MANTYVAIATTTVSSAVSSVTFSSIPSTYTDLLLKFSARNSLSDAAGGACYVQVNGSTTGYSSRFIYAYGSGSGSISSTATGAIFGYVTSAGSTASTFGNTDVYIPNYNSSNYKTITLDGVTENNATDARAVLTAGLWSNTSAITSVTVYSADINTGNAGGNFVQYSTFTLYGIKNTV